MLTNSVAYRDPSFNPAFTQGGPHIGTTYLEGLPRQIARISYGESTGQNMDNGHKSTEVPSPYIDLLTGMLVKTQDPEANIWAQEGCE